VRFLLDENVPFDLLPALLERGHDAVHVARVAARDDDRSVLDRAREEKRILVTFDRDFGRLIYYERGSAPPGVVYMRSRPSGAAETIAQFVAVLDAAPAELEGRFVVVEQGGQVRALPLLTRV
jgi:predicted nuclease of predicted toxin-antitoxin system